MEVHNVSSYNDTGKQVVDFSSLETLPDARSGLQAIGTEALMPLSNVYSEEKQIIQNMSLKSDSQKNKSRKRIWIAVGVLVAIIVGAALTTGLVLAVRKPNHTQTQTQKIGESSPTQSAIPAPPSESDSALAGKTGGVASFSSLAATAWTTDKNTGSFIIRLIYQNEDGLLQASTHDSQTGNWSKTAANFTRAKIGSPLGLTRFDRSIYSDRGPDTQIELFYLDYQNSIREWNWGGNTAASGTAGSLNNKNFAAHPDSRLSAYWPYIMFQNPDGDLHEVEYEWGKSWPDRSANVTPANGGSISVVPFSQELSSTSVFFQKDDGVLTEYVRDSESKEYSENGIQLNQTIPLNAPISTFSLLSQDDDSQLSTFILYQKENSQIEMRWRNTSTTAWNPPTTSDALKGADNGTSITCITMFTFNGIAMTSKSVPRCYFLASGSIREIELDVDKAEWKNLGNVPLD